MAEETGVDKRSAEQMSARLRRKYVPDRTVGGKELNPFIDPDEGDVYISPSDGMPVEVREIPSERLPEGYGYYWNWEIDDWSRYGGRYGFPFWWLYRLWWWNHLGRFGRFGRNARRRFEKDVRRRFNRGRRRPVRMSRERRRRGRRMREGRGRRSGPFGTRRRPRPRGRALARTAPRALPRGGDMFRRTLTRSAPRAVRRGGGLRPRKRQGGGGRRRGGGGRRRGGGFRGRRGGGGRRRGGGGGGRRGRK